MILQHQKRLGMIAKAIYVLEDVTDYTRADLMAPVPNTCRKPIFLPYCGR